MSVGRLDVSLIVTEIRIVIEIVLKEIVTLIVGEPSVIVERRSRNGFQVSDLILPCHS
jgi:hypothetical protein